MEDNREQQMCIRCVNCNKLLGKVPIDTVAEIEMKCPRCRVEFTYKLGEEEDRC